MKPSRKSTEIMAKISALAPTTPLNKIASQLGISRSTLYRYTAGGAVPAPFASRKLPDDEIDPVRLRAGSDAMLADMRRYERPPANVVLREGVPTPMTAAAISSGAGSPAALCASQGEAL